MPGTYYSDNYILDTMFRKSPSHAAPDEWYIGLATGSPVDVSGQTITTEISTVGTGYSRIMVVNNTTNFGTTISAGASSGITKCLSLVQFPVSVLDWGLVTHVLFWDSISEGHLWFWDELETSQYVYAHEVPCFVAGSLTIQNWTPS